MKWWQVALEIRLKPGLNGETTQVILDVQAKDRDDAIEQAKAALVYRAKVDFAIPGPDVG